MRHFEVTDFIYKKEQRGYQTKIQTDADITFLATHVNSTTRGGQQLSKLLPFNREKAKTPDARVRTTDTLFPSTTESIFQKYKRRLITRPHTVAKKTEIEMFEQETTLSPQAAKRRAQTAARQKRKLLKLKSLSAARPTSEVMSPPAQRTGKKVRISKSRSPITPEPRLGIRGIRGRESIPLSRSKTASFSPESPRSQPRSPVTSSQQQPKAFKLTRSNKPRNTIAGSAFPVLQQPLSPNALRRSTKLTSQPANHLKLSEIDEVLDRCGVDEPKPPPDFVAGIQKIIGTCEKEENMGDKVIRNLDKRFQLDDAYHDQFFNTVETLRQLDYADARIIPALFKQKMKDQFNTSVEAMQISREFKLGLQDPNRLVAKLEKAKRKKKQQEKEETVTKFM